jgi:hypothetical protein
MARDPSSSIVNETLVVSTSVYAGLMDEGRRTLTMNDTMVLFEYVQLPQLSAT